MSAIWLQRAKPTPISIPKVDAIMAAINGISSGNYSGTEVTKRSAAAARPKAEQPKAEQLKAEQPRAEQARAEQARAEQAKQRAPEAAVKLGENRPAPAGSPTGTRVRIKA